MNSRLIPAALMLCPAIAGAALTLHQTDTFQDGSTQVWYGSAPANIATDGPAGTGDRFVKFTANGLSGQLYSRLVARHLSHWTGDYLAAGVGRVAMDLKNFGATDLSMRLVIMNGTGADPGFATTTPFALPADGQWHRAVFAIRELEMTRVESATVTFSQVITNVKQLRIIHAVDPGIRGDVIASSFGMDNVTALPPAPPLHLTLTTNTLLLSWPSPAEGFSLEATGNLAPVTVWTNVGAPTNLVGGTNVVALPLPAEGKSFYRLSKP